ncbi:hypothetical protein V1511DRAFT_505699 [Dipodascopsis uninucleata]
MDDDASLPDLISSRAVDSILSPMIHFVPPGNSLSEGDNNTADKRKRKDRGEATQLKKEMNITSTENILRGSAIKSQYWHGNDLSLAQVQGEEESQLEGRDDDENDDAHSSVIESLVEIPKTELKDAEARDGHKFSKIWQSLSESTAKYLPGWKDHQNQNVDSLQRKSDRRANNWTGILRTRGKSYDYSQTIRSKRRRSSTIESSIVNVDPLAISSCDFNFPQPIPSRLGLEENIRGGMLSTMLMGEEDEEDQSLSSLEIANSDNDLDSQAIAPSGSEYLILEPNNGEYDGEYDDNDYVRDENEYYSFASSPSSRTSANILNSDYMMDPDDGPEGFQVVVISDA